jgi:hypothetical protein
LRGGDARQLSAIGRPAFLSARETVQAAVRLAAVVKAVAVTLAALPAALAEAA